MSGIDDPIPRFLFHGGPLAGAATNITKTTSL